MLSRILKLTGIKNDTVFLWGARQTGKSTLLKSLFPDSIYYDLLKSVEFERFSRRPSLLREELINHSYVFGKIMEIRIFLIRDKISI